MFCSKAEANPLVAMFGLFKTVMIPSISSKAFNRLPYEASPEGNQHRRRVCCWTLNDHSTSNYRICLRILKGFRAKKQKNRPKRCFCQALFCSGPVRRVVRASRRLKSFQPLVSIVCFRSDDLFLIILATSFLKHMKWVFVLLHPLVIEPYRLYMVLCFGHSGAIKIETNGSLLGICSLRYLRGDLFPFINRSRL